MPNVPVNLTASPGILNVDGALDPAGEAGGPQHEQRGAVLELDAGAGGVVASVPGSPMNRSTLVTPMRMIFAPTVPAGACGLTGAVTCSKREVARERLAEDASVRVARDLQRVAGDAARGRSGSC